MMNIAILSQASLTHGLEIAAAMQFGMAIVNLVLIRILRWKEDLNRLPLLIQEVFQVHVWFISVTLAIFAVMTWRFANEMSVNPACRWLATGIGFFWALRTVLQVTYYSSSHWRGQTGRTAIHVALLVIYGGFATVYLMAGFHGGWRW